MPAYDFRCPKCGGVSEKAAPSGVHFCGSCPGVLLKRVYSPFGLGSVPGAGGSPARTS